MSLTPAGIGNAAVFTRLLHAAVVFASKKETEKLSAGLRRRLDAELNHAWSAAGVMKLHAVLDGL